MRCRISTTVWNFRARASFNFLCLPTCLLHCVYHYLPLFTTIYHLSELTPPPTTTPSPRRPTPENWWLWGFALGPRKGQTVGPKPDSKKYRFSFEQLGYMLKVGAGAVDWDYNNRAGLGGAGGRGDAGGEHYASLFDWCNVQADGSSRVVDYTGE